MPRVTSSLRAPRTARHRCITFNRQPASRIAVGKRFGRFVPGEQRASRRLCRTLPPSSRGFGGTSGLPDFGKSSTNRGVCRVTSRIVRLLPDPPGGRVRRRVVGGSLPACPAGAGAARRRIARIENRLVPPKLANEGESRVACPLPGPVVGHRGKSEKSKLAERVGFEPTVAFWTTQHFQCCTFDRSVTSP